MAKSNIKNFSPAYLLIPLLLSIIGLVFIFSAGLKPDGSNTGQYLRQLLWIGLGLILIAVILSIDYYQWIDMSEWLYGGGLILLLITLLFGTRIRGAKSWLGIGSLGIQPSEIMKIFYILFFAKYLGRAQINEKKDQVFFISLAFLFIPLGFIMLQPDLGTSIVFTFIFLVMAYMGMPDDKYIRSLLAIGGITSALVLSSAVYRFYYLDLGGKNIEFLDIFFNFNTLIIVSLTMFIYSLIAFLIDFFNPVEIISRLLPFTLITGISFVASAGALKVLKPYQWKRLLVFINPEFDKYGAGYNIIQSKIAIGSGGLFGKGLLQGTQNNLGFLPEKSTDFIFSIISEELGFIGSALVLILFAVYFYYIIRVIQNAKDKEGTLVASGILAMFVIHFVINIGMTLGVAPVTGLPLPFVSYGGSSYLTFIAAAALLSNIYSHRFVH